MAATIKDIAKKTGLGVATISSYLNGKHVREYNRIKIEAAIEELHFEVNEVARGLKTNSIRTIGVVIPELGSLFFTEIISKASQVLRQYGYATIICECHNQKEEEREAIQFLQKKRVDGLLISPVSEDGRQIQKFAEKRPVVMIDRYLSMPNCFGVLVDNQKGVEDAMKELFAYGHTQIGFVGGPNATYTARERRKGYEHAMKEAGVWRDSLIEETDYSIRGGTKATKQLLKQNPEITALMVSNYDTMVGMFIALNELGMRVPEDISVIGYDSIEFARAFHPKLTIVTQPTEEIAYQAAMRLLKCLGEAESETMEQSHLNPVTVLTAGLLRGDSIKKRTELDSIHFDSNSNTEEIETNK